jgi:hypothetical protein
VSATRGWLCLALLVGCGGDEVFVCSVMTSTGAQCTEYDVPSAKTEDVGSTCAAEGGKVASMPCADKGSYGVCSVKDKSGLSYKVWVYPSSGVPDANTALAYCTVLDGKWAATK